MAKTVTLNPINPTTFEYQDYSNQDSSLIVNFTIEPTFDPLQNYVTYFIYDLNDTIVFSNEIDYKGYSFIDGQVVIDPEADLESAGFIEGEYNVVYNFLNNELSSSYFQRLYIDEISSDRTELRLNTTQISNGDLVSGANALLSKIQSTPGVYYDFYLDFGNNQLLIANNILLDNSNPNDPTVLIKLYEPLPVQFSLKSECWAVTQVAESVAYNINIVQIFNIEDDNIQLKGPNLNLNIKDQINNSTDYATYSTLTTSSYATGSENLQYQINSILAERGIEINVDYSNYNNFIYFSSALTRLENFYYKLQLIEEYQASASLTTPLVPADAYANTSKNIWQAKIDEIITTFDGYDYYLYYESSSTAWPKTNSTYPYTNAPTTNPGAGYNWFVSQSAIALNFDENNNNLLINSIPEYLRNDPANAEYELFVEMLGEMFDNIWIYYQDVTNKWNADNRLQYGVSKDLVADILRDLGLKIYQSSFSSADLYTALLGVTPSGSLFPFPYMTGSLPVPTGYEYITTSISASDVAVPLEDIEKSIYKRLYHNLPMLLKKKGTTVGLQDLITVYGIPSTILRVAEFGGKDKIETLDWDYWQDKYNYAFYTSGSGYISSSFILDPVWGTHQNRPASVQFRFKTEGITASTPHSQSLWSTNGGVAVNLRYSGSGLTSGSYSGSGLDPYYQYAYLDLIPNKSNPATSASIYLPFYDGGWWSVMVDHTSSGASSRHTMFAGNSIYDGDDGSTIGWFASASVTGSVNVWDTSTVSLFGSSSVASIPGGLRFSGSLQEVRYYTTALSKSEFVDYMMNPDSIKNGGFNTAPDRLAFRAALGGELYTGSLSIHPKVTGSWETTASFSGSIDNVFNISGGAFIPNTETIFLSTPAVGIKNIVSNKIHIVSNILPEGNFTNAGISGSNVLSPYISIQQLSTSSYTENLSYMEVAFSPQNEINDDVMGQLGFFNMGEFIGDPRQRFTQAESYPNLDALRDAYFEKYTGNYDINDYIRLIKFFDNSLFKMIKDFTPARSSLASGVVVKQHILERNKYPQPEVTQSLRDFSGSIDTAFIEGGAGGSVNQYNGLLTYPSTVDNVYGVTQSWDEIIIIPSGVVTQTHDSQDEFYNGEFSGSTLIVENGELNEANPYKNPSIVPLTYDVTVYDSRNVTADEFLTTYAVFPGDINIWYEEGPNPPEIAPDGTLFGPTYALINYTDKNSVNSRLQIENMSQFTTLVPPSTTNSRTFTVISVVDRGTFGIITLLPNGGVVTNGASANNQLVTVEPYSTTAFNNSEYNAIINNATEERLSEWYQQVDYATSQNIPVNFQQIISGTAYPAAVQDSNYTSYQYSGIRYWGSKNTTDNFNTSSISQSLIVQNYQKDNIGTTTLGYASVNKLDASILQFDWGGGTYPQIIDGGILALNDMLLVGADRDAVTTFPSQQAGFLEAVSQAYPISSYPVFNQYTTAVTTTANAQVAGYGWTTPSVSNYYIPSGSFGGTYGAAMITSSNPNKLYILDLEFFSLNPPGLGSINAQGYEFPTEATGSLTTYKTISASLAQGEDWYVSMYYNLGSVASGTLQPITGSSELSQQGVYKITSIDYPGGVTPLTASLNANVNTTFSASVFGFNSLTPSGTKQFAGLLIWKSAPGSYMRMKNATLSGLGKGGLVTSTPTPLITQEFTYITQTYGTNPKNQ